MLRYVRRGKETAGAPIGSLPQWLSAILRNRGIDTQEKAETFLHPALDQLLEPSLMQDMGKAGRIIRDAVAQGKKITVYGDYDVDGVCATSVMLETLREMGADPGFRIPGRHTEGYGLNEKAVRELAQAGTQLLITVDCGITNHEEVRLAQLLGMQVIVTDHHQPPEAPSPADAALNPLLGSYPYRRLCGAGVALKVCQHLLGMEAVRKRLDLAALATVADIVPLTGENRVIVKEGLLLMEQSRRPGLKALFDVAGCEMPYNAGQLGFRIAPRLNAAGRLETADQGVTLLTTTDPGEAERIAGHLNENNQARQAIEAEVTRQASEKLLRETNFRTDRCIVVMGEGWNNGIIGLAAGKICEKYHYPTIVLNNTDGVAVGSCRSIPGVNIYRMLTTCADLFERFGGHEQAAGLTILAERVPELKRRLNLAIRENCDEDAYIPVQEYDALLPLSQATLDMVDTLQLLEPTGYGNPAARFLSTGVYLQQARRVGQAGSHLKATFLDGNTVRDGIGFSLGELADRGLSQVDILFSPEANTWRGNTTVQLHLDSVTASGQAGFRDPDENILALLKEISLLAANDNRMDCAPSVETITETALRRRLEHGRGVLMIAHEEGRVRSWSVTVRADHCIGAVADLRGFHTLLTAMDPDRMRNIWSTVVLMDGCLLPGEAELLREKCPDAELKCLKTNPQLEEQLRRLQVTDEQLRTLYRRLRLGGSTAPDALARDCGLLREQVLLGLTAFREVGLAEFSPAPYAVKLLPPVKCSMNDSPTLRYIRKLELKAPASKEANLK